MAKTLTRMCVSCRSRDSTDLLVRLVLENQRLIVDVNGTAPGRGAYVHPGSQCMSSALSQKILGRALRSQGPLDVSALDELTS